MKRRSGVAYLACFVTGAVLGGILAGSRWLTVLSPAAAVEPAAQKAPRSKYAIDPAVIAAGKLPDKAPDVTSKGEPPLPEAFRSAACPRQSR